MRTPRLACIAGLILATTLGACSAGAAPSPTPSASPTPDPTPTAAPPTQVPGGIGSGGPNTGVGVGVNPGGGLPNPADGKPVLVVPKPGTRDPRPVSVESLDAQVDGRHVVVLVTWWSGVEPCYTLDTAAVKRDGNQFTVALTEGHAGGDVACIEIALQKATTIDLGELEPGEYTVVAQDSVAEPVTFTVT